MLTYTGIQSMSSLRVGLQAHVSGNDQLGRCPQGKEMLALPALPLILQGALHALSFAMRIIIFYPTSSSFPAPIFRSLPPVFLPAPPRPETILPISFLPVAPSIPPFLLPASFLLSTPHFLCQSAAAFLGLGVHLGAPRSQNAAGHLLGHVTDLGFNSTQHNIRIYQTAERQTFHTDR